MTNAPYLLDKARQGHKLGEAKVMDEMIKDRLTCPINHLHMGSFVEEPAKELNISRSEQDIFAADSNQKGVKSINGKRFEIEIFPVISIDRKGNEVDFKTDEYPRRDNTTELLANLRSAFSKENTFTAGNASSINDGAAVLLMTSEGYLTKFRLKPLVEIIVVSEASMDPKYLAIAPIDAVKKVLADRGLKTEDIELFELNEIFTSHSIALISKLEINKDIVNANAALGHPIGASGTRSTVTLLHEIIKKNLK